MLKQSLNAFKHGFKGVANGFDIALQQNRMDVEAVSSGLKTTEKDYYKNIAGFS